MLLFARLVAVATLASILPSQTFVVDANNGPGTHYTSLAIAVDAVPDGSTLIVRPGGYAPFWVTAKSLSILAEPGAFVSGWMSTTVVTGVTATQRVVIRGLDVSEGRITCNNCQGQLHFEDIGFIQRTSLETTACAQVSVDRCVFKHATAGSFASSDVTCVDSTFASDSYGGAAVVVAVTGRVQFVRCTLTGGPGNAAGQAPGWGLWVDGAARLLGPGSVSKGVGTVSGSTAIAGSGVVRLDGSVGVFGGIAVSPGPIVVSIDEASTSTTAATVGGTVVGTLEGSSNLIGGLLLGTALPPVTIPGIAEELWVNPFGFMAIGVLGTPLAFRATIPNDPLLQGALFGWQGMTLNQAHEFVLSNSAWFCVQ